MPELVSLADLMPTVLQTLKMEIPSQVQGRSLLPLIRASAKDEEARSLYAETFLPRLHFNWSELRGVESEKYHFIDAPKPELYDLTKDPGETQNLYSDKKAVGEEMRARLAGLIRQYSAGQELAEKTGLDPALMERLKSLGYAGFSGGGSPTITDRALPDPKDRIQVYELISDAIAESQHGEYPESTEKLNLALKTEPDSVPVRYLLGLNYYRMRQFPKCGGTTRARIATQPGLRAGGLPAGPGIRAHRRLRPCDSGIEAGTANWTPPTFLPPTIWESFTSRSRW